MNGPSDGLPVGLKNWGNTCYFNATLQVFLQNPGFVAELANVNFDTTYNSDENERIDKAKSQENMKKMIGEEHDRMKCLVDGLKNFAQSTKNNADIKAFYTSMHTTIFEPMERRLYQQEDSAELLVPMIEALSHAGMKRFDFIEQETLTCSKCKQSRINKSKHKMLQLCFPSTSNAKQSITSMIRYYCRQSDMDDLVDCEKCKTERSFTKKTSFDQLPQTFFIQIKRFGYDKTTSIATKTMTPVELDKDISMNQNSEKCNYGLRAIIYHHGESLASGHYTASVLISKDAWKHFNDETVSDLKHDAIISSGGTPYIIVYEKVHDEPTDKNSCVTD